MPKKDVDYSNTVIYKIFCKNETITDVYVGYTTNFIQRKYAHKIACNNLDNTLKIYDVIRCNGGWKNWDIVEIAKYNCKDATEARIKVQEWFNKLNDHSNNYEDTINTSKSSKKFGCQDCLYFTSRKSQYDRHLLTHKHKILTNTDVLTDILTDIIDQKSSAPTNKCECGKEYKHRQSLFNHRKKCEKNKAEIIESENTNNFSLDKDDIIRFLMKENSEIKDMLIEQNKIVMKMCEKNTSHINNSNINSNNKTFNLNVFLNEHCKDAMNINDFVDSLKLQLSDLENVGRLGFVEGITNIILKNLKALDIHKRPVHCSDSKREVIYVKHDNKWEKDNEDKQKLRKAIKKIATKNSILLPEFKAKHPDCIKASSPFSDQYNKLIIEALGGSGNDDYENENKIIRKIAKEITISK